MLMNNAARNGMHNRKADDLSEPNEDTSCLTMDNVHRCTTFELRQELKKRGHFLDDFVGPINYAILLEKTVQLLQQEKENHDRIAMEELCLRQNGRNEEGGSGESLQEKIAREKAHRKEAAVIRSMERQRSKRYFEAKKAANEFGRNDASIVNMNGDDRNENKNHEQVSEKDLEERSDTEPSPIVKTCEINPFAPRYRSKISGRYA